jgi:hypothetical protein
MKGKCGEVVHEILQRSLTNLLRRRYGALKLSKTGRRGIKRGKYDEDVRGVSTR